MSGRTGQTLSPTQGLGVLHLFCHLDPGVDVATMVAAEKRLVDEGGQLVTAAILGHKADVGFLALAPDLDSLWAFQRSCTMAGLDVAASYVSLTEVSEYAAGVPEELRNARLYPKLPPDGLPAFCFYPMSKRRGDAHNWYALDFDERKRLMIGHGALGRSFRGRVLQVVTGSTGLDDWEWGVTLFGAHPDDLKDCVYQMRFDEASAHYGEFGPFYAGMVADLESVLTGTAP